MKGRKAHVVPLSPRALEIIDEMRRRTQQSPVVFQGRAKDQPFGHSAVRRAMERIDEDATPHGWRKTFKTWATESGVVRDDVSELCLAHTDANKSRAAYNKADLIKMQRAALESWAAFLYSKPPAQNVLQFPHRA